MKKIAHIVCMDIVFVRSRLIVMVKLWHSVNSLFISANKQFITLEFNNITAQQITGVAFVNYPCDKDTSICFYGIENR